MVGVAVMHPDNVSAQRHGSETYLVSLCNCLQVGGYRVSRGAWCLPQFRQNFFSSSRSGSLRGGFLLLSLPGLPHTPRTGSFGDNPVMQSPPLPPPPLSHA